MKNLSMILPLALILCFMVGCQDKEAMAELEALKAQTQVEEQNKAKYIPPPDHPWKRHNPSLHHNWHLERVI
jgi:hypothetical protein